MIIFLILSKKPLSQSDRAWYVQVSMLLVKLLHQHHIWKLMSSMNTMHFMSCFTLLLVSLLSDLNIILDGNWVLQVFMQVVSVIMVKSSNWSILAVQLLLKAINTSEIKSLIGTSLCKSGLENAFTKDLLSKAEECLNFGSLWSVHSGTDSMQDTMSHFSFGLFKYILKEKFSDSLNTKLLDLESFTKDLDLVET